MTIKPIETQYNGYIFRSRLEARWAVFFDTLGIKYEYEKEGYDLGELGWYLPDFWLPEYQMFAEVKGKPFTKKERNKCICLVEDTPDSGCLFLSGVPDTKPYCGVVNLTPAQGEGDEQGSCTYSYSNGNERGYIFISQTRQMFSHSNSVAIFRFILDKSKMGQHQTIHTFPLYHGVETTGGKAVNKSRSARFEKRRKN